MYCKHCGKQIADDSVFCPKCGRLVIEAQSSYTNQTQTADEPQWLPTDHLQWKKPITARCTQIIIMIVLGLFSLYPLYCTIFGGKVKEYYSEYSYSKGYPSRVHISDPWKLKILKFTEVDKSISYYEREDAAILSKIKFRWKMFLVVLPCVIIIWLTHRWMKWTRFPRETDIVPRDVADEIEQYEWNGFTKYKYIFYKKDGKYGIIDARNYCVEVIAQYDSIAWRIPNRTFDGTNEDSRETFLIDHYKSV